LKKEEDGVDGDAIRFGPILFGFEQLQDHEGKSVIR
jgi:hypothetical protein